jgi:hypothetical protein
MPVLQLYVQIYDFFSCLMKFFAIMIDNKERRWMTDNFWYIVFK